VCSSDLAVRMKQLLVLFLFVGVALSMTGQQHHEYTASKARIAKSHLFSFKSQLESGTHQLQDLAACATALGVAQTVGAGCTAFTIFNDSYSYTSDEMNTLLTAHCSSDPSSCSQRFQAALVDVVTACSDVTFADPAQADSFWAGLGAAFIANYVPCLQDTSAPGAWCLVVFNDFATRLETSSTNPLTTGDLQAGCSPCTAAVLIVWLGFEANWDAIVATGYIDLVCLKIDTQYCYITFNELTAFTASVTAAGQDAFQAVSGQSDTYCLVCNVAFLHKWRNLYALVAVHDGIVTQQDIDTYTFLTNLEVAYAFACVADPAGNNCMQRIINYDTSSIGLNCPVPTGNPCGGACGTAVHAYADHLGCCLDTWLDLVAWICANNASDPNCPPNGGAVGIRAFLESSQACDLTIEPGCGERTELGLVLLAENLAWAWCSQNTDACENLILDGIAYQLGVHRDDLGLSNVKVVLVQGPPTTRRLLAGSNTQATVTGIKSKNSVGYITVAQGSVIGAPYDARATIDEAITFTTQSSYVKSAAAGVAPSLMALCLAIAAFLL